MGDTERSNNLWNRSNTATPPVMIEPTVTNIGTNRISRDFSVGDGKAGATAAVFSRSSVTQNIISTHTLPLVKPCETPFTASPFPPVCRLGSGFYANMALIKSNCLCLRLIRHLFEILNNSDMMDSVTVVFGARSNKKGSFSKSQTHATFDTAHMLRVSLTRVCSSRVVDCCPS